MIASKSKINRPTQKHNIIKIGAIFNALESVTEFKKEQLCKRPRQDYSYKKLAQSVMLRLLLRIMHSKDVKALTNITTVNGKTISDLRNSNPEGEEKELFDRVFLKYCKIMTNQ